jgi:hypothetical protein
LKVPSPLVKSAKAPTAALSSPVALLNSAPRANRRIFGSVVDKECCTADGPAEVAVGEA